MKVTPYDIIEYIIFKAIAIINYTWLKLLDWLDYIVIFCLLDTFINKILYYNNIIYVPGMTK